MYRKVGLFFTFVLSASLALAQSEGYDDYYLASDGKHAISVAADRLGVVTRERVSRDQIQRALQSLPFKVVQDYRGQLFILDIGKPLQRRELVQLARDLRERQKLFLQTGPRRARSGGEGPGPCHR